MATKQSTLLAESGLLSGACHGPRFAKRVELRTPLRRGKQELKVVPVRAGRPQRPHEISMIRRLIDSPVGAAVLVRRTRTYRGAIVRSPGPESLPKSTNYRVRSIFEVTGQVTPVSLPRCRDNQIHQNLLQQ